MPRTDLLDQSATRVELDQRSREARLRLEYVERLLAVRSLPRQSLLRRFLRRLGSRICFARQIAGRQIAGRQIGGRSMRQVARSGREHGVSGETGGGTSGGFSAAPPVGWANCSRDPRMSLVGPDRPPAAQAWHWCGRGD
jgi:hypothetical protein